MVKKKKTSYDIPCVIYYFSKKNFFVAPLFLKKENFFVNVLSSFSFSFAVLPVCLFIIEKNLSFNYYFISILKFYYYIFSFCAEKKKKIFKR